MGEESKDKSSLRKLVGAFNVSLETFILIVSVIFVVGASLVFLKHMFFANGVKDIYMNWKDIIYVSDYFDEDEGEQVVYVTIESLEGFPKDIKVLHSEIQLSEACPIIMTESVTVPTMNGYTLMLPYHFDSIYGFVREYHNEYKEEE